MEAPEPTYKTLRDEFAMVALAALMQNYRGDTDGIYAAAYRIADAMLAAREAD
jgi:hypothetical protein